jgi:hypothetical protein
MGNQLARDIAEAPLTLEEKLSWHLRANHYPPVDEAFIPVCIEAIELAQMNLWKKELEYPNGLVRTVEYTIDGLHLEYFLKENE